MSTRQLGDRDDDEEEDEQERHRCALHGTDAPSRAPLRERRAARRRRARRAGGAARRSRSACGCSAAAARSHSVRPCARRRCARHARSIISDGSANVSSERSTMTSRVAFSAAENGRRRRPLVVRSSSPAIRRIAELFVEAERSLATLIHNRAVRTGSRRNDPYTRCDDRRRRRPRGALATSSIPSWGWISSSSAWSTASRSTAAPSTSPSRSPRPPARSGRRSPSRCRSSSARSRASRRSSRTWSSRPPWTPDKMSEDAKFALGY